jgi:protein-tyrosine phosphatase
MRRALVCYIFGREPILVKLLFVCTGNICRSPTAEGIFRHRLKQHGLEAQILVDSAGMHGFHHGEPPDRRSIATARQFGVDISDLRARQVRPIDLDLFDIIAVMERSHHRQLLKLRSAPPKGEIRLLLGAEEVPDPYYDDSHFVPVYRVIEQGVDALFDEVRQRVNGSSGS